MKRVIHDQVASMQFRPDAHHRSVPAVLKDPRLSSDEKRAILSAWASDMYEVESSPMLRMVPGHAIRHLEAERRNECRLESEADSHAAIAPAVYHLARLRREADLLAASIKEHRDNIRRYKRILQSGLKIWNVSSLSGDWLKNSMLFVNCRRHGLWNVPTTTSHMRRWQGPRTVLT